MIDISNDAYLARCAVVEAMAFAGCPSAIYRPRLFADGDQWCALLGDDLMSGVAGFGETPAKAMRAFDEAFWTERTPAAMVALRDSDRNPEGEDAQRLSAEHESAGRNGIAHTGAAQ